MTNYQTMRRQGAPAGLDFAVECPTDWVGVPIPAETTTFDDVLTFAPVGVLMAPYAAIVFSVAGRPIYGDGTLSQWLEYVARERGHDPGPIEQQAIGSVQGVGCWGFQDADGTPMRVRLSFFADGERLVHIACMAPNDLWATVAPTFEHMLATFALQSPQGGKVALAPEGTVLPASTMAVPKATSAAQGPLPMPSEAPVLAATVALATTMDSFDAEHPLNARLRDNGAGLVPNVLDYHEQEHWATLAPAALRGTLRVPFGWHVVDDGKRTLVFDAAGHTQISLQLLRGLGRSPAELLAEKVPELQREWPAMQHVRTRVGGCECLCVRGGTVNGASIEQAYLLREAPDAMVLQTRVTSSPEHFRRACDVAEVLLANLCFAGEVPA